MSGANNPTIYRHLLPANAPPPDRRNWKPWSRKYGHPYRTIDGLSHRVLKNTGKSGLTPLSPFATATLGLQTNAQRRQRNWLYYYQKDRFFSFTAAELQYMEALSAVDLNNYGRRSLTNNIHKIFDRSQWVNPRTGPRHLGFPPMLGNHQGLWTVCRISLDFHSS